jgi:FkbM family methyltransferase
MKLMLDGVKWLISRPRTVLRASRKLGWRVALQLVFIRLAGRKENEYSLRVRGYPHPITIRGGASTDSWVLYELLARGEYELVGDLQSPAFIIDGGANVGLASIYFLERYPTARIVAVEPDPTNFALCRKNLAPYGQRVTLVQGAIWKDRGRLVLGATQHHSSIRVRSENTDQPGSVEAFPVPSLIARCDGKVDLLKLDIEGSETELFGPGAQEWLPAVRNIVIELHGQDCAERFFRALEGFEYDLLRIPRQTIPVVACRNLRARADRTAASA